MPKKINNYKVDDKTFIEAVQSSSSIRAAILKLGLVETGNAYKVFKRRIKSLQLNTEHFLGCGHLKGKSHNWSPKIPLEKILVAQSSYTNSVRLKSRLINDGLLKYECSICGISNWNNKELSLQLDHINGISNDHQINNLRLLCPNCHSQTGTFAGRNKGAQDQG